MALTDVSDGSRIVLFGTLTRKVTLIRACKAGDVLGVAEDSFDDLGPAYSAADAHATGITYLPRLVAATAGIAGEVITAYGAAIISGYSSGATAAKVYMAQTSGTTGQISETLPTGTASCGSVIGKTISATQVSLFPAATTSPDTITAA